MTYLRRFPSRHTPRRLSELASLSNEKKTFEGRNTPAMKRPAPTQNETRDPESKDRAILRKRLDNTLPEEQADQPAKAQYQDVAKPLISINSERMAVRGSVRESN